MKSLTAAAVVALAFIQFKNPEDNAALFVLNEDAHRFGASSHADGFARDKDGNKLPIGVRIHGAGSAEYRKAEDKINTDQLKNGKKSLTGKALYDAATYKLARCTAEFVNFSYAKTEGGEELAVTPAMSFADRIETATAFYDDLRYAALRDQVLGDQADHANFTPKV